MRQALDALASRASARLRASCPTTTPSNVLDVLRWPGVLRDDTAVGEELLIAAAHALFAEHARGPVARTRSRGRRGCAS